MRYSEEEAAEILARLSANRKKTVSAAQSKPVSKSADISTSTSSELKTAVPKGEDSKSRLPVSGSLISNGETLCEISNETSEIKLMIPIAPVTKKNHSKIVTYGARCSSCGKGKFLKLVPSDAYKTYEKDISPYLALMNNIVGTIDYPINLKCIFYCKKRCKGDLVGYLQAIQDLLVSGKIIEDDNRNIVASTDGSRVLYDPQRPRTEITISKVSNYEQWSKKDKK